MKNFIFCAVTGEVCKSQKSTLVVATTENTLHRNKDIQNKKKGFCMKKKYFYMKKNISNTHGKTNIWSRKQTR